MSEDTLIAPLRVDLLQASALEDLSTRVMEEMDLGTLGASGFNLNESGFNPAPKFNEMSLIKTVVLSLMFVISMIGNSATLVQMYRMRRRRSTINTLIMHLATADLIVTFFCNVTDAVWASTVQWYAGNSLCKLVKFLQVFGLYLSTYIIVIISVDRCYAILDPMSRNNAAKRVRILIGVAWSLSALFSLPQVSVPLIIVFPVSSVTLLWVLLFLIFNLYVWVGGWGGGGGSLPVYRQCTSR